MKFVRFLIKEFLINGVIFAICGTAVLSTLYLLSVGATSEQYLQAAKSFFFILIGKKDFAYMNAGFTPFEIISAGAKYTLPLTLLSFIYLIIISLFGSSFAVSSRYYSLHFGEKAGETVEKILAACLSLFAAAPLFVGFWIMYTVMGNSNIFIPLIGLVTVLFGGLSWDSTKFLKTDMLSQVGQTHAIVFSTLGRKTGKLFPLPGTYTGYLFSSSLPRFIPYLAGKVPAIIGSVTIAEIAFDFPGLGKNLIDALVSTNTNLLITSVFVLLCINAVVTFLVKTILFLIYPRVYEKAI